MARVAAGRDAQEVDDWDLVFEGFTQPSIIGSVRVLPHEGAVDCLVALEDLAMPLALIVVLDLAARLGKDGLDRQQEPHLPRLEDAALWIDIGDALAVEDKSWLQLGRRQGIVHFTQPAHVLKSRQA